MFVLRTALASLCFALATSEEIKGVSWLVGPGDGPTCAQICADHARRCREDCFPFDRRAGMTIFEHLPKEEGVAMVSTRCTDYATEADGSASCVHTQKDICHVNNGIATRRVCPCDNGGGASNDCGLAGGPSGKSCGCDAYATLEAVASHTVCRKKVSAAIGEGIAKDMIVCMAPDDAGKCPDDQEVCRQQGSGFSTTRIDYTQVLNKPADFDPRAFEWAYLWAAPHHAPSMNVSVKDASIQYHIFQSLPFLSYCHCPNFDDGILKKVIEEIYGHVTETRIQWTLTGPTLYMSFNTPDAIIAQTMFEKLRSQAKADEFALLYHKRDSTQRVPKPIIAEPLANVTFECYVNRMIDKDHSSDTSEVTPSLVVHVEGENGGIRNSKDDQVSRGFLTHRGGSSISDVVDQPISITDASDDEGSMTPLQKLSKREKQMPAFTKGLPSDKDVGHSYKTVTGAETEVIRNDMYLALPIEVPAAKPGQSSTYYVDFAMNLQNASDFDSKALESAYIRAAHRASRHSGIDHSFMRVSSDPESVRFHISQSLVFPQLPSRMELVDEFVSDAASEAYGNVSGVNVDWRPLGPVVQVLITTPFREYAQGCFDRLRTGSVGRDFQFAYSKISGTEGLPLPFAEHDPEVNVTFRCIVKVLTYDTDEFKLDFPNGEEEGKNPPYEVIWATSSLRGFQVQQTQQAHLQTATSSLPSGNVVQLSRTLDTDLIEKKYEVLTGAHGLKVWASKPILATSGRNSAQPRGGVVRDGNAPFACHCDEYHSKPAAVARHLCRKTVSRPSNAFRLSNEQSVVRCMLPQSDDLCPQDQERCMQPSNDVITTYKDYKMTVKKPIDFNPKTFVQVYTEAVGPSVDMILSITLGSVHFLISQPLTFSSLPRGMLLAKELAQPAAVEAYGNDCTVQIMNSQSGVTVLVTFMSDDAETAQRIVDKLRANPPVNEFQSAYMMFDSTNRLPVPKVGDVEIQVRFECMVDHEFPSMSLKEPGGKMLWAQGLPDDTTPSDATLAKSYNEEIAISHSDQMSGKKVVLYREYSYIGVPMSMAATRKKSTDESSGIVPFLLGALAVILPSIFVGWMLRRLFYWFYEQNRSMFASVYTEENEEITRRSVKRKTTQKKKKQDNTVDIEFEEEDGDRTVATFHQRPPGMLLEDSQRLVVRNVKKGTEAYRLGVQAGWHVMKVRLNDEEWVDVSSAERTYVENARELAQRLKMLPLAPYAVEKNPEAAIE